MAGARDRDRGRRVNRTAIVHDWLVTYAGAERVLEQLLLLYPEADLYAVCDFVPDSERGFLRGRTPRTTFIQRLPGARRRYRSYLPLMPMAISQLDVSDYDLVISSSHAVAKGVRTGPTQLHVSYVHTPIRYAWDLQEQYLRTAGLDRGVQGWLARGILRRIRTWDERTADDVDHFVANSAYIADRIRRAYGREAEVVYPPVDVEAFPLRRDKSDYFLAASRLVPYKRIGLVVEAFADMPDRRLKVIGDGPERAKIEALAHGHANIEMLGYQPAGELREAMQKARAFVFAAEEDFGIMPVEAQACGTPVIAYGRGGTQETVVGLGAPTPTGVFFNEQTSEAIIASVQTFEANEERFDPGVARRNAERFSPTVFRTGLSAAINRARHRFDL